MAAFEYNVEKGKWKGNLWNGNKQKLCEFNDFSYKKSYMKFSRLGLHLTKKKSKETALFNFFFAFQSKFFWPISFNNIIKTENKNVI